MARKLTDKEKENILDFIKPNKNIPLDTAMSIVNNHKNRLLKQLSDIMIYPEKIGELKKYIIKNFISTQIDPGECVGIIAAQSIGEKQTQNSIAYYEKIIIKKKNKIIKDTIGNFIDTYMEENKYFKLEDGTDIMDCKDCFILTITENEKIEWKEINVVSRHLPKGNLIKVITDSGRKVVSTLSHSHLKKDNGKVVPVLGSDLKLGDRIPVIKQTPIPDINISELCIKEYIQIDRIGPYEYDSDGNSPKDLIKHKTNYVFYKNDRFNNYIIINENFINIIVLFLINGKIYNNSLMIKAYNNFDHIKNNISLFTSLYDINYDISLNSGYFLGLLKIDNPYITVNLYSKIFSLLINNICYEDNKIKRVPQFIFESKKHIINIFLKNWFIYEGYNINNTDLFINDIIFLLTYFGIYSRNINNKLKIQLKYMKKFIEVFEIEIPLSILEDNFEVFYDEFLNENILKLSSKISINNEEDLNNFILKYEDIFPDSKKDIEYLKQIQKSNVVWERIINLELIEENIYTKSGYKYVYDFSVNKNETFALFSGIVVHNTLNSVDWKEKILYTKNNTSYVEPIGQMIDDLLLKHPESIERIEENRTEYLQLEDGYFIPSCDEYGNTGWYKIEAITKHLPVGDLVEVTTESGRTVIATQSKSFLVWSEEENKFIATEGCNVKIGDILPTTEGLPRLNNTYTEYIKYSDKIIKLDRETGYILGLFLTNNIDILLLENDIKSRHDKWFLNYKLDKNFIDDITDYKTTLPNFIFTSSDDCIKGFLSGYFRNCTYENGNMKICSNNEVILNGINFLLSYFQIFAFIDNNTLIIKPEYTEYFERHVIEEIWRNFYHKFLLTNYKISNLGRIRNIKTNYISKFLKTEENIKDKKYNVYFDKVIDIKYVKGSTEYVYDLTVEKTRNFQLFNGLNVRDTLIKG